MAPDLPLAPGFYVEEDGTLHCDVPALLRSMGIEPTPEAIDQATEMVAQAAERLLPPDSVVDVEE